MAESSAESPEAQAGGKTTAAGSTLRRWLRLRGAWLAAALISAILAGALAVMLPLRANIDQPASFADGWRWWLEPSELNAFARKPAITEGLQAIAIAPDGKTALAVGDSGTLLRSTDAGASWQAVAAGTEQYLQGIAIAPDGKTALAVGTSGTLLRSTDAGASWQAVAAGTAQGLFGIAIAPDGKTALAVGSGGTLLRSTDAGASWHSVHGRGWAPVVWLLFAIALVLAAPMFWPLPPVQRMVTKLSDIFSSDRALQEGEPDAAGAGRLAKRISDFLINPRTEPPLTLAITGDWGSGKSSVLNLLAAALRNSGRRPVWFNAWHHQKEEHLFAALLQAVREQAVPPLTSRAGLAVRARLAWSRIRRHWLWWLGGLLLLAALAGAMSASGFPSFSEAWKSILGEAARYLRNPDTDAKHLPAWQAWTSALLSPIALLAALRELVNLFGNRLTSSGLDPGRLMAAAAGATRWRDLGGQLAFRVQFAEALREVTDALGNNNLTILVDDLDRCDPRAVAEVMEAVNFLTSSGNCFVILAVARIQVLKAMGLAHAEMAKEMAPQDLTDEREIRDHYAQRYLDKLIQIEIPVPRFDAAAAGKLISSAAQLRDPPPDRAWLAALAMLAVFGLSAAAFLGGQYGWQEAQTTQTATSAPASVVTVATPPQAAPAPSEGAVSPPPPAEAPAAETRPAIEIRAPASPWHWWLLLLGLPAVVAGLAAGIHAWRKSAVVDKEDAPEFTEALNHWATAAFMARPSPREMKRFLNRLRLAATDPAVPEDATTVGLAAIAQVDRSVLKNLPTNTVLEVAFRMDESGKWAYVRDAIKTLDSDLAFKPDPLRIKTFLDAWTGFTIRA